jgi:Two component regulator propeller
VAGLSRPDGLAGPVGQRVYAIRVSPTDGDVWIATDHGLTRYSEVFDSWSYYTRAEGVPSNSIQSIAFDKDGNIFCATQYQGLIYAKTAGDYRRWYHISGPDPDELPTDPAGSGLPSNLLNDVMVSGQGWIFVATDAGLAWSCDNGKHWRYTRGQDYAAKVQDGYGGPPQGWKPRPGALLNNDYVTCLAQDGEGRIQVGHRATPVEAFDLQPDGSIAPARDPLSFSPTANITCAVACPGTSNVAFGCYYSGAFLPRAAPASSLPTRRQTYPTLPSGAAPPTKDQLNSILTRLAAIPPLPSNDGSPTQNVAALQDDWRTRGD